MVQLSTLSSPQVPTDKCEKNEEIWQHRVALEGLQQREIRLMAEVAELRTTCERQRKEGVNENLVSPHPVSDLLYWLIPVHHI